MCENSDTRLASRANDTPSQLSALFPEANLAPGCLSDVALSSGSTGLAFDKGRQGKTEWNQNKAWSSVWLHNIRLQFLPLLKRKAKPSFFLAIEFNQHLHTVYEVKRKDSFNDNIFTFSKYPNKLYDNYFKSAEVHCPHHLVYFLPLLSVYPSYIKQTYFGSYYSWLPGDFWQLAIDCCLVTFSSPLANKPWYCPNLLLS